MPGAAPDSKKQNHLVAGRRKLEAYRKKKAEEKKAEEKRAGDRNNLTERVGDGNNPAEKPIANDSHAEGIFANGFDSSPSIEGNGKETYEVLHSSVGVNGEGAWSVADDVGEREPLFSSRLLDKASFQPSSGLAYKFSVADDVGERSPLFSSRLLDKASFQPSSGLVPVNPTALASIPYLSDYKGGSSLSVSASDGSLAHAFPEQEKDLKPVNQNEGRQMRAENDDFIALEQHIDELTQEKFALQRALDAARSLAESLSQQNSVLTEDFNSQGAIINQLQADLEKKKEEVTSQSLVLSSLMMERERTQQENNSAVERSQILAGEVIDLEEKVLKLRSSELKLQRELETLKSDNASFRVHLGTLEKDRQNMRSMLEALQEDKKLLQIQLQKTFDSNDGMRMSSSKVPKVDSIDASTSTDDLGVQTENTQRAGQIHVSHHQSNKSLDYKDEASSSILVYSPHSISIGVPSAFATLSADEFRAIKSIDGLITELFSEKGALLESLERESAKASELQALNMELSKKLEAQTQRLELVVSQNMVYGANAIATNSIEMEPQYNDYVDEGDEVVERVLGWITRLFPGGSSRRQSSKHL